MTLRIVLSMTMAAACLFGQAAIPAPPAAPAASFLSTMTDPMVLSLAAYDLANVAQGTTAWKFSAAGKTYHVSPVQQTGITAASTIGAAAIAHKWPRLKTPLTVLLGATSAYYGGKAYAQAQHHGTVAPTAPIAPLAAVRLR